MNITKDEVNRMSFLLGKSKNFVLNVNEHHELRTLIDKEQICPLEFDKMINLGLIIVGTYTVLETYEKIKNDKDNKI